MRTVRAYVCCILSFLNHDNNEQYSSPLYPHGTPLRFRMNSAPWSPLLVYIQTLRKQYNGANGITIVTCLPHFLVMILNEEVMLVWLTALKCANFYLIVDAQIYAILRPGAKTCGIIDFSANLS